MDIPVVNALEPAAVISEQLNSHGVVIVKDLLSAESVDQINRELAPYLDQADQSVEHINPVIAAFFGNRTRHVAGVAGKSPAFVDSLMCHPQMLGICDQILLPNCASYQLNLAHLMVRGPGTTPQPFHRDEDIWIHLPRPHKEVEVASMTALVDFTAENGATLVVPGSHRWERDRQPEPAEIRVAAMPAGSAVIYLGSTLHGGGANQTAGEWRSGLHMSYAAGWLRTEENNYLQTPPDVARNMPRRARELLGYQIHDAIQDRGGYLGMLDLKDPMKVLFPDQPTETG